MPRNLSRLAWLDLEMTGLDPEREVIIEIATIITDDKLEVIDEGPSLAIHQSNRFLDGMDEWNSEHHGRSGLVDRVRNSKVTTREAEIRTLTFLQQHIKPQGSPLCGNTVGQDRRFLRRYMPDLEAFFHYRNLDVSTIKELILRWKPSLLKGFSKTCQHIALEDVRESIAELRYYREHAFKL